MNKATNSCCPGQMVLAERGARCASSSPAAKDAKHVSKRPRHGRSIQESTPFDLGELPEALDRYANGAILRITLCNFLTYRHAIVRPGPWMNMVMGPNGSGKSSIVAAIAIGLGANTTVLGRSKHIEEYIMYGEETASIEIVLKSSCTNDDDAFIVVKRVIKRSDKGKAETEWVLNGRPVLQKTIKDITASMNINLDNLCQFLPQDKVSEFARLSSTELLKEAEKTAVIGDSYGSLFEMHNTLCTWRTDEQIMLKEQETDSQLINSRQEASNSTQRLFQAFEDRQHHLKMADFCRKKTLLIEYNESREQFEDAKKGCDALTEELRRADLVAEPLRQRIQRLEQSLSFSGAEAELLDERQSELRQMTTISLAALADNQSLLRGNLERTNGMVQRKEREVRELQVGVSKLSEEINALSHIPSYDPECLREELHQSMMAQDEAVKALTLLEGQVERVRREGESINTEIADYRRQLNRLADAKERRRECIQRVSPDTIRALDWLNCAQNRDLFRSTVYGPIALDLHVKKNAPAGAGRIVEGLLSRNVLNAFVFTSIDDQKLFMRKTTDEMGWRVGSILVDATGNPPSFSNAPSLSDMRKLGFECFAVDFIEGPEAVIRAICEQNFVNITPVTLSHEVDHDSLAKHPVIRRYCSLQSLYTIKVSRYSAEDRIVRCTVIRPPVLFTDALGNDDQERLSELYESINRCNQKLQVNADSLKPLLNGQQSLQAKLDALRTEHREIVARRRAKLAESEGKERKKSALATREEELKQATIALKKERQQSESSVKEYDKVLMERFECAKSCASLVDAWVASFISIASNEGLQWIQRCAELDQLSIELSQASSANNELRSKLQEAEATKAQLKQVSKELLGRLNAQGIPKDAAVNQEYYARLPDSPQELFKLEASELAKAESLERECTGIDFARLQREQAERQRELEHLRERAANRDVLITELHSRIGGLREEWMGRLRPLVNAINDSFGTLFATLGCVGQVDLEASGSTESASTPTAADNNDFSNFQLVIRVKFRAEEHLQKLSATRQSGGEKSVTTILFLLALSAACQSLPDSASPATSPVPFRVVDEINQGMDAVNERRVHKLVVETSVRSGSQYFLITPKLLSGLEYIDKMHVLCVLNY